ncbi:MAG: hypothetical protein J0L72_04095 [Armatimonadetes bacterium]|nr:hypothetical protein [Armatimonadota bacterium]
MNPEIERRNQVISSLLEAIADNRTIKLPQFDPSLPQSPLANTVALIGLEPNDYCGHFGEMRYQFEGEEDLLHLIVTRIDGDKLSPKEAQEVAALLFDGIPVALIRLHPGVFSQHFYIGHDDVERYVTRQIDSI